MFGHYSNCNTKENLPLAPLMRSESCDLLKCSVNFRSLTESRQKLCIDRAADELPAGEHSAKARNGFNLRTNKWTTSWQGRKRKHQQRGLPGTPLLWCCCVKSRRTRSLHKCEIGRHTAFSPTVGGWLATAGSGVPTQVSLMRGGKGRTNGLDFTTSPREKVDPEPFRCLSALCFPKHIFWLLSSCDLNRSPC